MKLLEFKLFKDKKSIPEEDEILDTIYFRSYGDTNLDMLDEFFKRMKGKKK